MLTRSQFLFAGRHIYAVGCSLICFWSPNALANLDPPHDAGFGTGCQTCHDMTAFDQPDLIPLNGHVPLDQDDTLYNNVCWGCHDGITAMQVETHSSRQIDNGYGDWSIECSVCHNQHTQEQDRKYGTAYGQFIRSRIDLSEISGAVKSGLKEVVLLAETGANSFADGDTVVDGICEVCHTQTMHWRNDGSYSGIEEHSELKGSRCLNCHPHNQGFRPTYECLDCHDGTLHGRAAVGQLFRGNSHHIQTGAAVTSEHCHACHWEADPAGEITVYHGATPASPVDLVIYGAGARPGSYAAGSTAMLYTADGSRTQIESLNSHCLGCHSDQNNGVDIFNDGKSPDQYAWDGSSVDARYSQTGSTSWGKYTTMGSKKDQVKAFSAHGNATLNEGGGTATTWTSSREGTVNVACYDCHNSHGSNAAGTTTSYTSATINGGLLKNTSADIGGYTTAYTPQADSSDKGKYAYNSGAALCFDCHQTNYSGPTPWGFYDTFGATRAILGDIDNKNFGPVDARITHSGGHFGISFPLTTTPTGSINGLCTPCHDPHGVSTTLNQEYGVPLLKGTWLTSGYRIDIPPPSNFSESPAWFIDQNTFTTTPTLYVINEVTSEFGGLCLQCHTQNDLDPDTDNTWKTMDRVHDSVKGWGNNTKHNYPCSKCHTAHATTRRPRLMQSNCMDYRHKGGVGYNASPHLSGSGSFPGATGCHEGYNGFVPGQSVKEQYWNNVTRWEDRDGDDSLVYPSNPGLAGEDCDDNDNSIYRAIDGTCDGDSDGVIDASAGGQDCDDNDNAIGHVPGICDKDGDGIIDWNVGGYDCDDNDPLVGVSPNGFCN